MINVPLGRGVISRRRSRRPDPLFAVEQRHDYDVQEGQDGDGDEVESQHLGNGSERPRGNSADSDDHE